MTGRETESSMVIVKVWAPPGANSETGMPGKLVSLESKRNASRQMWKEDREENKNPTKGELQNQLPLWKMHLQNEICF